MADITLILFISTEKIFLLLKLSGVQRISWIEDFFHENSMDTCLGMFKHYFCLCLNYSKFEVDYDWEPCLGNSIHTLHVYLDVENFMYSEIKVNQNWEPLLAKGMDTSTLAWVYVYNIIIFILWANHIVLHSILKCKMWLWKINYTSRLKNIVLLLHKTLKKKLKTDRFYFKHTLIQRCFLFVRIV